MKFLAGAADFNIQRYEYDEDNAKLLRHYVPQQDHISSTFHHLDLNNDGSYQEKSETHTEPLAGNFSQFAKDHPNEFYDITIDWGTYQHIRREKAWEDLATLLAPGSTLVIPVTSINIQSGLSLSQEKAETLKNKIAHLFSDVTISSFDAIYEQNKTYQELYYTKDKLNGYSYAMMF